MKVRRWIAASALAVLGAALVPAPAAAQTGSGQVGGPGTATDQDLTHVDLTAVLNFVTDNPDVQYNGPASISIHRSPGAGDTHTTGPVTVTISGSVDGVSITATCTGMVSYTPPTFALTLRCAVTITTPFGTVTVTLCIEITGFIFVSISGPPFTVFIKAVLTVTGC